MDTATGPCVPTGNRQRALAGALRQEYGELPRHTAALYTVLTGLPPEGAMAIVDRQGDGTLHRCTDAFVDAMADEQELLHGLLDEDLADGDEDRTRLAARVDELERAWLAATGWPRDLVSLSGRLARMEWARLARERGHPLYAWHGPSRRMYVAVPSRATSP